VGIVPGAPIDDLPRIILVGRSGAENEIKDVLPALDLDSNTCVGLELVPAKCCSANF
jgi:hypothetical protein